MAFVPAPNIMEVEFLYTLNAQNCENRVMVNNLGAVAPADLEAIAIACWNWWEGTYAPNISTHCGLRAVQATDLTTDTGSQFVYAPDTTTTGGESGAAMPNETSLCLSFRSTSRGRSARGRWYLAGLPRTAMGDDNDVHSGYASAVTSDMQALVNAITTAGKELTIVSYVHNGAPRVGGPVYFPVVSVVLVDPTVDSQRRRKPGVGS